MVIGNYSLRFWYRSYLADTGSVGRLGVDRIMSSASMSSDPTWKLVNQHYELIVRCVDAAIHRGYLSPDEYQDAIHRCKITAYDLAQRDDVENYSHLLAKTLRLNLRRDGTRPTADAMDHSRQFQEVKDPDSGEDDGSAKVEEEFPALAEQTPLEQDDIKLLIETRVPPRLQQLARMKFILGRTIKRIANSTGRTVYDVDLRLRHCHKLIFGRKQQT
jgi:DNA-directed RNA polymerase specialized sigma24 family protein